MTMSEVASTFRVTPRVLIPSPAGDAPTRVVATRSPGARHAKTPTTHKAALLIGVAVALALANTEAAPLVDALLIAGIVYQTIQITGGRK